MSSWAVGSWPGLQHRKWFSSSEQAWHLTRKQLSNPFQSQHTGSTQSKTKTLLSVFCLPSSSCLLFMVPLSLEGDDGDASPRAGHLLALSTHQLGVSVLTTALCMGKLLCHGWGESACVRGPLHMYGWPLDLSVEHRVLEGCHVALWTCLQHTAS